MFCYGWNVTYLEMTGFYLVKCEIEPELNWLNWLNWLRRPKRIADREQEKKHGKGKGTSRETKRTQGGRREGGPPL